jgi:hypothetical protein
MTARTAPRPTSVVKAIDLLSATKTTIKRHGRPRRRPNIDGRPIAVSASGKQVSPYSPGANRWSLPGAFKADAKALGYSESIISLAGEYFVKAYGESFPYAAMKHKTVELIDINEFDTREIIRSLQRAIVTLQGFQS